MVYSHIIFQHQPTKGIFTLTLPIPIRLQQALLQDGCPENPHPMFITVPNCISQTGHFSVRMMPLAKPASIFPGTLQIFFAAGPNLQLKGF